MPGAAGGLPAPPRRSRCPFLPRRYLVEFGFTIPDRAVVVDDVRVRGTGSSGISCETPLAPSGKPARVETVRTGGRGVAGGSGAAARGQGVTRRGAGGWGCVPQVTRCYFEEGYLETPVFLLEELACDHAVPGPAILIDRNSTIVVEPGCTASLTRFGDVRIAVGSGCPRPVGPQLDAVQLSIFSHRFMSIAEQMGRILQRTAISTNIKERLDFSCALFGPDGGLVSNAPHIPVHLGAMQETVQFQVGPSPPPPPRDPNPTPPKHTPGPAHPLPVPPQIRNLGEDLREGDVILSNHPCAGGSHLPDLTVITPVFWPGVPKPVFFVASRGHHADIGGITPGSMPPHSKALREEGAVFVSFKLVKDGVFQEEAVTEALMAPGRVPGCSGSRNLRDNLSDLRAQVAANQKGIQLVAELIRLHGLPAVQAYMAHIQANAEVAVREMLKGFAARWGAAVEAEDRMDDGSPIRLRVQVDPREGSAVFDFSGSGPEVYGNCNAPRAITLSALIYCLRCMVGQDIPLNQGCLAPVRVVIPRGSILDPSPEAAVVGGNVLTSQRVVDVIFRAFGVCAASQGCMNNVTFGNARVGYYETVAGGAGAGPRWHGRSGVHTHMTNTRITDPEILEQRWVPGGGGGCGGAVGGLWGGCALPALTPAGPPAPPRYPVVLRRFELRRGSGGAGRCRGGDGVTRELLFREDLVLSVLSERRAVRPYGLRGGSPGAPGLNLLLRRDGRTINLGAKTSVPVEPGDVFRLQTPGGGGFGSPGDGGDPEAAAEPPASRSFAERGSLFEYRRAQEAV
ncbi:hypothetical protein QYF61_000415 [Mycteria americana]|uniref:Hydantoinase B/oxoprolinase domain-containing protein n=1 Tax=Mycteria americana TaxID=33587 RepID=A0AAN7MHH9_MYCAM|nr:hypothetical protein QYF61_000415 [Mycteria americana]